MAVVYTKKEKRNIWIRVILLVILLIVIVSCVVVIANQLKVKKGVKQITADTSLYKAKSSNYKFYYYLDNENGKSISGNQTELRKLFSKYFDEIYSLIDYGQEHNKSIYFINHHINEEIEIDSLLYDYLYKIYNLNPNYLLMGPLYDYWFNRIYISDREQALAGDPANDEEIRNNINYFINTSINNISIEFKENNIIKLNVLEDYKTIYDDIENPYINFGMFEDAIILDYLKQKLNENGYYHGVIFVNNLSLFTSLGDLSAINMVFKLTSLDFTDGFYSLEATNNMSTVMFYDFIISGYPIYYVEDNIRSYYISDKTGYSLPLKTSIFYKEDNLLNILNDALLYFENENILSKYICLIDKKIHTNDNKVKSDVTEVIYEYQD